MARIVTYNFTFDPNCEKSNPKCCRTTLTDRRNNIDVINIVPQGTKSYLNYLDLLISLRDKWVSVGYLDLGMIPILMGPTFMHETFVDSYFPIIQNMGLPLYAMPGVSFLCDSAVVRDVTDYWAFRDDVGKFLGMDPNKVRTKDVFNRIMGGV